MTNFPGKFVVPTQEQLVEIRARNMERARTNPNCFTHWYPAVLDSGTRSPRTLIIPFSDDTQMRICESGPSNGGQELADAVAAIRRFGDEVGYPLFLKNSLFSGKHSWKKTCFIKSSTTSIEDHITEIAFEWSLLGNAYALYYIARELIPTTPAFTAFDGMPITAEYRVFARDGVAETWQPYWPEEAFEERGRPDRPDWKEALKVISTPLAGELDDMRCISEDITRRLGGHWSVDFLRDRDGALWVIDMALTASSYVSHNQTAFDRQR